MNETVKRIDSTSELITVKEASTILEKSPRTIRNSYIEKGILDVEYVADGKKSVMRVYLNQVHTLKNELDKDLASPFGELYLENDESLKLLDSLNNPHKISDPRRYFARSKYLVSNKGRIINLSRNSVLKEQTVAHGYKQVKIGKRLELVHIAVASQWCPNGKFKSEVHHIDGNKTNNAADNLVFATDEEHTKAEKLLKSAKESGDWTEYNEFIETIRTDNAWKENIRVIVDPTDNEKGGAFHIWYVTEKGYCGYKSGQMTWDELFTNSDIRAECYYN